MERCDATFTNRGTQRAQRCSRRAPAGETKCWQHSYDSWKASDEGKKHLAELARLTSAHNKGLKSGSR